ncbi:hypothetical protein VNO78_23596 [Psophocarpus tetragonolobus]|uniref:UDENN domain-containing protein n=1 Tax=Psophocarpus tetragonolobus TaxID=3891 RepID=A0AAN9XEK1_PSOTE
MVVHRFGYPLLCSKKVVEFGAIVTAYWVQGLKLPSFFDFLGNPLFWIILTFFCCGFRWVSARHLSLLLYPGTLLMDPVEIEVVTHTINLCSREKLSSVIVVNCYLSFLVSAMHILLLMFLHGQLLLLENEVSHYLWLLWELLLVGEPILIVAPRPPQCCEAVASLVSLVAPLLCSVDFRPYLTIHDPKLSVTSHIVSVGSAPHSSNRVSLSAGSVSSRPEGLGPQQLSLQKFSPSNLLNAIKLRTEYKEAIWTNYSATTKPDTSILKRFINAGLSPGVEESMSVVNNEILRRHFLELTTNFLAPFGPYFRPTAPLEGSSPYVDPPSLPPFDADGFLASLSARGPGKFILKRMKSNWRFLHGPNFMPWFQRRCAMAEHGQDRLWRHARMKTDIRQLISKMSELEIVDSFSVIERLLVRELQVLILTATCRKLMGDLQAVFNALTKDMQQVMLSNPQRASLLQGSPELTKLTVHALVLAGDASSTSPT